MSAGLNSQSFEQAFLNACLLIIHNINTRSTAKGRTEHYRNDAENEIVKIVPALVFSLIHHLWKADLN